MAAETKSAGIKETKEVLELLDSAVGLIAKGAADGSISIADGLAFIQLLPKLKTALDGAQLVKTELSDLDEGEVRELADKALSVCTGILKVFGAV